MLTQYLHRRSAFGHGSGIVRLLTPAVFRLDLAASGLGDGTFSRASAATYVADQVEPAFSYLVGGSLSSATVTRASVATQTRELTA